MRPSQSRGRIGGLRGQLLFGLIALLVLTLALVATATLQFHKQHLRQAVADEARRHAEWLAHVDDPVLREYNSRALENTAGILHAGPLSEELKAELDPTNPNLVWMGDYQDEAAVWAVAQGASDNVVILSLAEAQEAIDSARRALFLYLISTLLFVTLVGYAFFSFIVVRPLRALGVAAERAAGGDLASPVAVLPRNEFGEVGRRFNRMLDKLDEQRAELEEQLEQLTEAHEDLKQAQESLIRSEKMASVGHLAAGVAHEVGNPLAAVMGYADLLRDRSLDQEAADDLADRTLVQLERIRRIIRQLLDYSRTDSESEPTPVDVEKIIDEALHLVQATAEGRRVDVDVDISDALVPAQAIAGEIEQVLLNLLLNAVKAMDGEPSSTPKLKVSADVDDLHVILDIEDNGPGIEPEIADQIFEPFFTTRSPGAGTGLGLAIAERLVSRVDGELRYIPSEEGAHFRIRLRRADALSNQAQ